MVLYELNECDNREQRTPSTAQYHSMLHTILATCCVSSLSAVTHRAADGGWGHCYPATGSQSLELWLAGPSETELAIVACFCISHSHHQR